MAVLKPAFVSFIISDKADSSVESTTQTSNPEVKLKLAETLLLDSGGEDEGQSDAVHWRGPAPAVEEKSR